MRIASLGSGPRRPSGGIRRWKAGTSTVFKNLEMNALTEEQRERIAIAREDLLFLQDEWDHDVSDASLRRSSTVLRRLIVDRHLGNAWRDIGFSKEPLITAPKLEKILEGIAPDLVSFASAGGARHQDVKLSGFFKLKFAPTPEMGTELNRRMAETEAHRFSLSEFSKSLCLVVEGTPVSRSELIKYVTNKLGGAHFDPKRDSKDPLEKKFLLLDSIRQTMQLSGTNAVLFELLSIGQSIIMSQDIVNFLYASGGGPFVPKQPSILD